MPRVPDDGAPESELASFFAKPIDEQAAELRALAEEVGALRPPRPPRPFSPIRTLVEAFVLTSLAIFVGWLLWLHWHSLLAGFLPLVLVAGRAFRWRRFAVRDERQSDD